jgi:glutamate N-acetyltransferase/amino-acid N-acetyltransferase
MSVTFAQGFSAAGVEAGISSIKGKKDLALVVNDGPLDAAAGVFTANRFCAAPVQWTRKIVADGHVKAVIPEAQTHAPASRDMSSPRPRPKRSRRL